MTNEEFNEFVVTRLAQPANAKPNQKRKRVESRVPRCGECGSCNKPDCGFCINCLDKPKFGGKGLRKKACIAKVCTTPVQTLDTNTPMEINHNHAHLPFAKSEVAHIN